MKKIYNNLNIENLIKTDWFNQFYEQQQKVILLGLEQNLDKKNLNGNKWKK